MFDEATEMRHKNGATRTVLRFLIKDSIDKELIKQHMIDSARKYYEAFVGSIEIEAIIPLSKRWENHELIYLSMNDEERVTTRETIIAEERLLEEVKMKPRKNSYDIPSEYRMEINEVLSENDINNLIGIFKNNYINYMIEFNRENITDLLRSKHAIARYTSGMGVPEPEIIKEECPECKPEIVTIEKIVEKTKSEDKNKIVAATFLEGIKYPIEGKEFYLGEISDSVTDKNHRSRGLNKSLIYHLLVDGIRNEMDLIYTESRANHTGVLRSKINLGMQTAGRLIQHCVIDADAEVKQETEYGDLIVFFANSDYQQ